MRDERKMGERSTLELASAGGGPYVSGPVSRHGSETSGRLRCSRSSVRTLLPCRFTSLPT